MRSQQAAESKLSGDPDVDVGGGRYGAGVAKSLLRQLADATTRVAGAGWCATRAAVDRTRRMLTSREAS